MNSKEIKHLIQNGEKIDVEFKESKNALTKDVFDFVNKVYPNLDIDFLDACHKNNLQTE